MKVETHACWFCGETTFPVVVGACGSGGELVYAVKCTGCRATGPNADSIRDAVKKHNSPQWLFDAIFGVSTFDGE